MRTWEDLGGQEKQERVTLALIWALRLGRGVALPDFETWAAGFPHPDDMERWAADMPAPPAPPKLMAARLAGIARKVAEAQQGERNSILYWAYCRLVEGGHSPEAWNVIAFAARQAGLPNHEIYRTLRAGKGVTS